MRDMKYMKKNSVILSLSKDQLPGDEVFHAATRRSQRGARSDSPVASAALLRETSPPSHLVPKLYLGTSQSRKLGVALRENFNETIHGP